MTSRYYDPCSGTATIKWRWRIAGWMNHLPRTCWANIVSWALGSRPMLDLSGNEDDIRRTSTCFQPGDERCYCGKFANLTEHATAAPTAQPTAAEVAESEQA